ncbi:MAG: hypothetical protein IJG97_04560 [Bacilli bacterium]|nr:hypothetical protein [Bacilli bacterium]
MFGKKFSSNIRRKKRMIISSIILLVVFLGIGYSAFTTNLGINGTLKVDKYDHTLYGVLEKAVNTGHAREYTGEHHDSFTEEPTKNIYHWYAPSGTSGNALATEILDKNNVIFANHCWQMIRTTDTGGVKMIYNGETENNQCLNTRGNHPGYSSNNSQTTGSPDTQTMSATYYYGTSYTFDKANNVFSLDGNITTGTIQAGQYTCRSTSATGTCATLYLVNKLSSGTTYYVLPLKNSSTYATVGLLEFNSFRDSPAYVGYMYNTSYTTNSKKPDFLNVIERKTMTSSTRYYYGTGITYDTSTGKYTLTGTSQDTWANTYSTSSGLYTCASSANTQCSTVYYIAGGASSYMCGFSMTNGNLLNYYNTNIILGTGYTENNGTYTLNGTVTIKKADWFSNYGAYKNYYTCGNATSTCTNIKYITSSQVTGYYYLQANDYIYAKNFTYNSGTNTYILDSDRIQMWDLINGEITDLNTHHYTCFNTTGNCTTLSYVYHVDEPTNVGYIYYINLTNGKSVDDAINEMLSNNDINQTNSIIKTGIDAWYKKNMIGYTSKLEDTIFCNDRSISSLGGWNPNGGNVTEYLLFKNNDVYNNNLSCTNITDKFSLTNTKAQLTYPVGLLTYPENYLLYSYNLVKTGNAYFLLSPNRFSYSSSYERYIMYDGNSANSLYDVTNAYGVRPVISLKPGTEYASGSGSMADPYVVE